MANYAEDCKDLSPRNKLLLPALETAHNHLMTLIDHLCNFWQPKHLIDTICSAMDNKQEINVDEYAFAGFEDGSFLNLLDRFPACKEQLTQQVSLVWEEDKECVKAALVSMIAGHLEEVDAGSAVAWLKQTHHCYCLSAQKHHMILLQWSERGKEMAHIIVTCYLTLMQKTLSKVQKSIVIHDTCFLHEETIHRNKRIEILQQIKDCVHVMQELSGIMQSRAPLFFQQRLQMVCCC